LLCTRIYEITKHKEFNSDFRFRDQISNSSGSAMDNIAEGFERGTKNEFLQFLGYSKGSAGECKSQLYRALDVNYIAKEEFEDLTKLSDEIIKMLGSLIAYLNKTKINGLRSKDRLEEPSEKYEFDLP
jgi:four helix bundle protein